MRKLRLTDMKKLAQDHTAISGLTEEFKPRSVILKV
jgi:hypothetical protein